MPPTILDKLKRASDTRAFAQHDFVTGLMLLEGGRLELYAKYIGIFRYDPHESDESLRMRALMYLDTNRVRSKLGSLHGVDFLDRSEAVSFFPGEFGENPHRLPWIAELGRLVNGKPLLRFQQTSLGTYKLAVTCLIKRRIWLLPIEDPKYTAKRIRQLLSPTRVSIDDLEASKRYYATYGG